MCVIGLARTPRDRTHRCVCASWGTGHAFGSLGEAPGVRPSSSKLGTRVGRGRSSSGGAAAWRARAASYSAARSSSPSSTESAYCGPRPPACSGRAPPATHRSTEQCGSASSTRSAPRTDSAVLLPAAPAPPSLRPSTPSVAASSSSASAACCVFSSDASSAASTSASRSSSRKTCSRGAGRERARPARSHAATLAALRQRPAPRRESPPRQA